MNPGHCYRGPSWVKVGSGVSLQLVFPPQTPKEKMPQWPSQLQVAFEAAQTALPGLAETRGRQPHSGRATRRTRGGETASHAALQRSRLQEQHLGNAECVILVFKFSHGVSTTGGELQMTPDRSCPTQRTTELRRLLNREGGRWEREDIPDLSVAEERSVHRRPLPMGCPELEGQGMKQLWVGAREFHVVPGSNPGRLEGSQGKWKGERHSYRNQFSLVQSLSRVQLFVTPWSAARQASTCCSPCGGRDV